MTLVVDASVVVAALVDDGVVGRWSEAVLRDADLAAPHLMPIEAANILRRGSLSGQISADTATLAHADLCQLPVVLFPYGLLAGRTWDLRSNVTVYDACYIALAEILDVALVTLDRRLAAATGPRCTFQLPPLG